MDPKPRPNDERYLEILRRMTPEQRLRKAFELTEFTKSLALAGLRARRPGDDDAALRRGLAAMRLRWASTNS